MTVTGHVIGQLIRTTGAMVAGPVAYRALTHILVRHDIEDSGLFSVVGTTTIAGLPDIPVSARVRLFYRNNSRLIRETWSDAAGVYRFDKIKIGPFTVMAQDLTDQQNAVVADNVFGSLS